MTKEIAAKTMPPPLQEGAEESRRDEMGEKIKMDEGHAPWATSCDECCVQAADRSVRIRTVMQALGATPLTEDLREHVQRAVELSHAQRASSSASLSALNFSYLVDIDRESGRARVRFDLDTDAMVRNCDTHMSAVLHDLTHTHTQISFRE